VSDHSISKPTERLRPVDNAEFARYRSSPGDRKAEKRFADHILSRYPGDVWALSTLALQAPDDREFELQIRHAIRLGLSGLAKRVESGESVVVLGDAPAEATLQALLLYANHLAIRGRADEATGVLRTMLDLDPSDYAGAIPMMAGKGIVVAQEASPRMN
jgi:hypothetical protein